MTIKLNMVLKLGVIWLTAPLLLLPIRVEGSAASSDELSCGVVQRGFSHPDHSVQARPAASVTAFSPKASACPWLHWKPAA